MKNLTLIGGGREVEIKQCRICKQALFLPFFLNFSLYLYSTTFQIEYINGTMENKIQNKNLSRVVNKYTYLKLA